MKTWEMIKELTENPEKEFICKSKGIFAEQKAFFYIDEYGEECIKIVNNETGNAIERHHANREWEEVVEHPVSFMELLERVKNDGELTFCYEDRVENYKFKGRLDDFLSSIGDTFTSFYIAVKLTKGKFYIED